MPTVVDFRLVETPARSRSRRPPSPALQLPPVIGHRGAAARAPENTLAGLRRAKALGCSWVEFDVRLTADGVPVLCHDARLDRTTDRTRAGGGPEPSRRSGDCDAGAWFGPAFAGERVPTLDEALALAAELDLGANIEIKAERGREYATAAAVADIVQPARRRRRRRCWYRAFSRRRWRRRATWRRRLPRGVLFRLVPSGWAEIARRLGCVVIGADHRRLRPRPRRRDPRGRLSGRWPTPSTTRRARGCCSHGA